MMSILGKIRLKTAVSISSINEAENFLWNKWLRAPLTENKEIEELYGSLINTGKIVLSFPEPALSRYEFHLGKHRIYKSSPKHFSLKSKTFPVYFGFGTVPSFRFPFGFSIEQKEFFNASTFHLDCSQPLITIIDKSGTTGWKLAAQVYDYSGLLLTAYNDEIEAYMPFLKSYFFNDKIPVKKIDAEIKINGIKECGFRIPEPEVKDYLARLIPKIFNIELLNIGGENILTGKYAPVKIDLLDSHPMLNPKRFNKLTAAANIFSPPGLNDMPLQFYSTNYFNPLSVKNIRGKKIKIEKIKAETGLQNTGSVNMVYGDINIITPALWLTSLDALDKFLQPEIVLSEEEENAILKNLYPFQKEGVKFLIENENAILCDEPGLGKTVQAAAAIKYLFKTREIKSVLILSADHFNIDASSGCVPASCIDWQSRLNKFSPGINSIIIGANAEDAYKEFNSPSHVYIISQTLMLKAISENRFSINKIKNFDCLILDDAETAAVKKDGLIKLFRNKTSKFLWLLSNEKEAAPLKSMFSKSICPASLGRGKDEVYYQMPDVIRQDFWIDLDKEQKLEYDQSFFLAQSQIHDAVQTGNPFRVQAKVFALLHQLKQIINFASTKSSSNKSDLLMYHLAVIKKNMSQVIIFSQYDKYGTQKLTELLNSSGIKFTGFQSGMSLDETEESIRKFSKDKSITVFLAGTQQALKHPHLPYAPYIIYFDQWWIPIPHWQIEDKIRSGRDESPSISVFSYLTRNTVEEKLSRKLIEKDLLNRNITGNLGADNFSKLITENEWIDIFSLGAGKSDAPVQEDPSHKMFQLI